MDIQITKDDKLIVFHDCDIHVDGNQYFISELRYMEIIKIGITKDNLHNLGEAKKIELLAGKGIIGDRHFRDKNNPKNQLTLIESENIDYYNKKFDVQIPYINFRRNIITKGIKLNDLIGKQLIIGEVRVRGNDLCRPCKHLQEILNRKDTKLILDSHVELSLNQTPRRYK